MIFKLTSAKFTRKVLKDLRGVDLTKEDFHNLVNALGKKMKFLIAYESANSVDERIFRGMHSPSKHMN